MATDTARELPASRDRRQIGSADSSGRTGRAPGASVRRLPDPAQRDVGRQQQPGQQHAHVKDRATVVDLATRTHVVHEPAMHVAFSNDGELTAVASRGKVCFYDRRGEPVVEPGAHDRRVVRIDFHPDGRRFATAGVDGAVRLWDLRAVLASPDTAKPLLVLRHRSIPWHVDFAPDGRHVLTTAQTTRVWDLNGAELFHLPQIDSELPAGERFSADGRWIVGMSPDGVLGWPARPSEFLRVAREYSERIARQTDLSEFAHLLGDGDSLGGQ